MIQYCDCCVAKSVFESSKMMPTSGNQFHFWAAILSVAAFATICDGVAPEVEANYDIQDGADDVTKSIHEGEKEMQRTNNLSKEISDDVARTVKADDEKVEAVEEVGDSSASSNSGGFFKDGIFPSLVSLFYKQPKPWWQGENVCVVRETQVDYKNTSQSDSNPNVSGGSQFLTCKQTPTKYICTTLVTNQLVSRKIVTTYQCCHGFKRTDGGCEKVNLKSIGEVLSESGAAYVVPLVKTMPLGKAIFEQNLTFFVPSDEAAKAVIDSDFGNSNQLGTIGPDGEAISKKLLEIVARSFSNDIGGNAVSGIPVMKQLILSHVVKGFYDTGDFCNEKILVSADNKNSTLRLNIYPGRTGSIYTVNCADIVKTDLQATKSVIHILDRIQMPVEETIADILDQPVFSRFKKLLEVTGMLSKMADREGPLTVFAPTNVAFDNLDRSVLEKYNQGAMCAKKVVQHHILEHTLCSVATKEGSISTLNSLQEWLKIEKGNFDVITIDNETYITDEDQVATNGVLHAIDKLMIPMSANPVAEVLAASNHMSWLDLIAKAGLKDLFETSENVTLFVPSENALKSVKTQTMLNDMSTDKLEQVLKYHIAIPKKAICDCKDEESFATKLENQNVTIQIGYSIPFFHGFGVKTTVQCALLEPKGSLEACNAAIHTIDRIMLPPQGNILDALKKTKNLSFLSKIIQGTKIEKELEAGGGSGMTLLAPSDDAFVRLLDSKLKKLMEDKEFADKTIRKHLINEVICCSVIGEEVFPFITMWKTLSGKSLVVRRVEESIMFAATKVTECDIVANDGVIHVVDKIMLAQTMPDTGMVQFGSPKSEILLYGI